MQTLEMRFGNPRLITGTLLEQFRKLPNLNDDMSKLVEFATKLQNAVTAIRSVSSNEGYLHNPDLVDRILRKLPRFMLNNYARYRPRFTSNSDLERISDFMILEAKLNIEAGTIPIRTSHISSSNLKRPRPDDRKSRFVDTTQQAKFDDFRAKRPKLPEC